MSSSVRATKRRYAAVDARRADVLAGFRRTPFTSAEAQAAGLTRSDLASDAVTQIRRGVYVAGQVRLTHELRCAAVIAVAPAGARIAGVSAARLHGLPVPLDDRIRVGIASRTRVRLQDCLVRQVSPSSNRLWFPALGCGVPVTPVPELLAECIADLPFVDAVVLADAVLHTLPPAEAEVLLAAWRSSPSMSVARVSEYARIGVESAMESRTRVLIVTGGLPEPVVQFEVVIGGRRRRLDMGYPEAKVAVEYDGGYHFADEGQKQRDVLRWEELERAGWIVVRVVSQGIYRDPLGTLVRVRDALRTRGVRCDVGPGWEAHFTQRGLAA